MDAVALALRILAMGVAIWGAMALAWSPRPDRPPTDACDARRGT